jgi:peptidyl-prolyl cis-trans isomerase SurA
MTARVIALLTAGFTLGNGADFVTVDRIAIIVGGHAIKTSDVDRDIRATEFLNNQPLDLGAEAKRQAAQRLVDQQIIRSELNTGSYRRPNESEAAADLSQIERERFGGSDARLRQDLERYGLTEDDLRARLLWQLTVLSFIDQRFRPGVLITDQDLRNYYNQHRAEYASAAYETVAPKVRETLAEEQINQQFVAWLDQQRKDVHIQFIQGALE